MKPNNSDVRCHPANVSLKKKTIFSVFSHPANVPRLDLPIFLNFEGRLQPRPIPEVRLADRGRNRRQRHLDGHEEGVRTYRQTKAEASKGSLITEILKEKGKGIGRFIKYTEGPGESFIIVFTSQYD
jgi:hypothetical protein